MAATKTEQTGSFRVIDEAGETHLINVFTRYTEHAPLSGPKAWVAGSKTYRMSNGNHVNPIEGDAFEEVGTSRKMRLAK